MIEHGIEGTLPRTSADMKRVDRVFDALGQKDKLMKKVRKHLRLKPNPDCNQVRIPNILDRFHHNRTQQRKPTLHFFTSERNVPLWPAGDILDQENPFTIYRNSGTEIFGNRLKTAGKPSKFCPVPRYCDESCQCKDPPEVCTNFDPHKNTRSTQESKKSELQEMNGCAVNEILTRLQVPTFSNPPSKIDLEPDYFDILKGRPLSENFIRTDFIKFQRMVFFQSLYMGYFQDDIRRRQEQFKLDMWELENTDRVLDKTKKNYEHFISEAHNDSVNLVKEQLILEHFRQTTEAELIKRRGVMTGLKSHIYKRDYKLSNVLLCRDLLLKLSPPTFRVAYTALVARNKRRIELGEKMIQVYTDYCRYNPEEGKDFFLDEAIQTLLECIKTLGPPMIYFKHYWEIDMVLRKMEVDCVSHVADIAMIDDLTKDIEKLSKQVNKYFTKGKRLIDLEITTGEAVFHDEKLRSIQLVEDTNNEINTFYKEVACGDPILETIGLVEELHKDIFGRSKQKFDVMEMMNQIEKELNKITEMITHIPQRAYEHYERKVNKRLIRERNEPIQARRRYRETKSYIKRISGMYDKPPIGPRWRKVVPRSSIISMKRKQKKSSVQGASDVKFSHLQLDKICIRDDLEEDIELIINRHAGGEPSRDSSEVEVEDITVPASSLWSSVDTLSMEKVLGSMEDDIGDVYRTSFDILELGYDSNESLIRGSKKRNDLDEVEEAKTVLYDVRSIDDRFIVEGVEGVETRAEKDKRHSHRPDHRANFNQLVWR